MPCLPRHHHQATPFVSRFVKPAHDRMAIRIDGQHRKRLDDLASYSVGPTVPNCGHCERLTVLTVDAPAHGFAGLPAGLKEPLHGHQTHLPASPCRPVAGLFRHGLGSRVVGASANVPVFSPTWDQAKQPQINFQPSSSASVSANDWRRVPRKRLSTVWSRSFAFSAAWRHGDQAAPAMNSAGRSAWNHSASNAFIFASLLVTKNSMS